MNEPTILAALTLGVLQAADAIGLDARQLRERAGLTEADLADPDGRIPAIAHFRLHEAIAQQPVGLELGRQIGVEALGLLGYVMQHETTVRSAYEWLARFRALLFEPVAGRLLLMDEGDQRLAVFSHVPPAPLAALREPPEAWAAATVTILRGLTGRDLQPVSVAFPHSPPDDVRRHTRFFRCTVHWNAPSVEVAFEASVLDLSLARSNPALAGYLGRRAEALLAKLPEELSTSARVRQLISAQLPLGEPPIEEVARALATSTRTLHRRLKEEGTRFSMLLDEARRQRAELLLGDPRLTISQVGFLLGYAEPAAFFRAFRRWFALSPQTWRRQRRSANESDDPSAAL